MCILPYFHCVFSRFDANCKRFGEVKHTLLHRSVDQIWTKACFLTVCLYRLQTVSHVSYRAPPANRYLTSQPSFGHILDVFLRYVPILVLGLTIIHNYHLETIWCLKIWFYVPKSLSQLSPNFGFIDCMNWGWLQKIIRVQKLAY